MTHLGFVERAEQMLVATLVEQLQRQRGEEERPCRSARTHVSLQLQQGSSAGTAAAGRDNSPAESSNLREVAAARMERDHFANPRISRLVTVGSVACRDRTRVSLQLQ